MVGSFPCREIQFSIAVLLSSSLEYSLFNLPKGLTPGFAISAIDAGMYIESPSKGAPHAAN